MLAASRSASAPENRVKDLNFVNAQMNKYNIRMFSSQLFNLWFNCFTRTTPMLR